MRPGRSAGLEVDVQVPYRETTKSKKDNQMPHTIMSIKDKIELYRTAWRDAAAEASFAGMTLSQFEAAIRLPMDLRDEIAALELELKRKKSERADADLAALELLKMVVNSVRGTAGFGDDSPLYANLGYVRMQNRKSGKTNKSPKPAVTATAA